MRCSSGNLSGPPGLGAIARGLAGLATPARVQYPRRS
jgi:hypothetical protein